MTNWYTLAPEVHDIILSFFCKDIIHEYSQFNPEDIYRLSSLEAENPVWPKPPEILRNFTSALLTCRSFYHTLNRLKLNGRPPITRLQSVQARKCILIAEHVLTNTQWDVGHVDIGVFMRLAGVFWKNPVVCKDFGIIVYVMEVLEEEGLLMLIPHLEEWVTQHVNPMPAQPTFVARRLDDGGTMERYSARSVPVFQTGSRIGPEGVGGHLMSIKGLYEGSEVVELAERVIEGRRSQTTRAYAMMQQRANRGIIKCCPVLKELGRTSEEWWLFSFTHRPHRRWWILVNFREKWIWGNMCEPKLCVWDDLWEPSSWKVGEHTFDLGWLIAEDNEWTDMGSP